MIFKEQLILKILRDKKRQTRRPIKAGHIGLSDHLPSVLESVVDQRNNKFRLVYAVGQKRCLQPGRTKAAIWYRFNKHQNITTAFAGSYSVLEPNWADLPYRVGSERSIECGWTKAEIEITRIRCEDVRKISYTDVLAEGFEYHYDFWQTWCSFYDPRMVKEIAFAEQSDFQSAQERMVNILNKRPESLYQAWVLDFKLFKEPL